MKILTNGGLPIPLSFTVVVAMVVALFIFFGAWAVSVDAANQERELSFPIGNNAGFGVNAVPSGSNAQPRTSLVESSESAADTWWGNSLLLACPLH